MLCCQPFPDLPSVEAWFKALANTCQGCFHQKLFSGLYAVYWLSVHVPGTRVAVAAGMGACWCVAVPEHGGVMKVPGSEAPFPLLLRKGLGCRDVPDLWLFVAEGLK